MASKIQIDLKKVEEYAQVCDNEVEIATALGISYATFRRRKSESEQFEQAIKRGKAKANIFVGGKLMEAIKRGNIAAIIFYMKSRCGWRDVKQVELSGVNGDAVKFESDMKQLSTEQLLAIASMETDEQKVQ